MPKRKRTIVIIPPAGKRIWRIRIRAGLAVLFGLALLAGFAGYAIPFDGYALDSVEQTQKRNLNEQNRVLLKRILDIRRLVGEIQTQVNRLETTKNSVVELADMTSDSAPVFAVDSLGSAVGVSTDSLYALVNQCEAFAETLQARIETDDDYFDHLPILLPVEGSPRISAGFGERRDPFTDQIKMHHGMDFVGPRGVPVLAAADGVVASVSYDKKWGHKVTLRHANSLTTVYAHLGSVEVRRGRRVARGDMVGTLGQSGLSVGPHLHYEVRKDGVPLDPALFFFPLELPGRSSQDAVAAAPAEDSRRGG